MTEDEARQRVIRAMCPDKVCNVCGEPSRRITEHKGYFSNDGTVHQTSRYMAGGKPDGSLTMARVVTGNRTKPIGADGGRTSIVETVGWSDCGHDDWRPGVWLDPFAER